MIEVIALFCILFLMIGYGMVWERVKDTQKKVHEIHNRLSELFPYKEDDLK